MTRKPEAARIPESEAGFQAAVIDLARLHGWLVHHTRPARRGDGTWRTPVQGDPGAPDLLLARAGRVIHAELKTWRGRLTPAQERWALEIRGPHGANEWYCWRPKDWDRIIKTLTRGARD